MLIKDGSRVSLHLAIRAGWASRLPIAIVLLTASAAPIHVHRDQHAVADADVAAYDLLVAAYQRGDAQAIPSVLESDRERFRRTVSALGDVDTRGRWPASRLTAAAMMHTDAAFSFDSAAGVQQASEHLDLAIKLIDLGGTDAHVFASRWYVAAARVLRDRNWLPEADRLLEVARKRLRDDSQLLCESGTLAELFAADPSLDEESIRRTTDPLIIGRAAGRDAFPALVDRRNAHLRQAGEWLSMAVQAAGADSSCRIHLGRVLSLVGDHARAEQLLAPPSFVDDAQAYLAALFLAASAERRQRLDVAEADYRYAISRIPQAHAAYIGLSSLLFRSGRNAEARAILNDSIARGHQGRREPWWWYFYEPSPVAVARLDALRREVRK